MPALRPGETVPGVCPSCSMEARPPSSAAIPLRPGTEWLNTFEYTCNVSGHEQARANIRQWIQSALETRNSGVNCPLGHGPAAPTTDVKAHQPNGRYYCPVCGRAGTAEQPEWKAW